jgi:hypothetical protein
MAHQVITGRSRLLVALSTAAIVASLSASAVLAGEITGNGRDLRPLHANSECAFSGLDAHDGWEGRTQSWGQMSQEDRAFLTSIGVTPGTACNGHLNPMK